jgi:chromosome segregation protein
MRNHAEVTLVIDNSDRSAPSPYNELDVIEITRRIEREAGSLYRINGREARQRDVQIFFADASTGSASPALVRQGQIGVLINQKPLARRAILEEAAGISGLHQRRHEAELRLKAAETNLARLNDVIAEVDTQLQALRRQARQASRYRSISGLIHKAEAILFLLRWRDLAEIARTAEEALGVASETVAERTALAAQASTEQAEAAAALPPLRNTEAAKSAALQRLLHERDSLDAEEARAREEAQRIRQRIGEAGQDLAHQRSLEQDAGSSLAELEREFAELTQANVTAAEALAAAEQRARTLADTLAERERTLEQLTSEFAHLNATRASYERAIADGEDQARRTGAGREALQERAAAETASEQVPDIEATDLRIEDARAAAAAARTALESAEARLAETTSAEADARAPFEAAEAEVQRLSAETRALTNLLRPKDSDLWPPLIDSIKVQPGYEAALAAALGDELNAPLDEAAPLHWRNLGGLHSAPDLPGGEPLYWFVNAPPALGRRLSLTGVVSVEDGGRWQKELQPGQRLVSQRGDLWRWDGYTASADAPSQAAARLEQRNQLEALETQLGSARQARASAYAAHTAAQAAHAAATESARAASRELREREEALLAAQADSALAARAVAERTLKLAAVEAELKSLEQAADNARRAVQSASEALNALPDVATLSDQLDEARGAAVGARIQSAEARAALDALRNEVTMRGQRLSAVKDDSARWVTRRDAASRQIAALEERVAAMTHEIARVETTPELIAQRRTGLLDAIGTAEAARKAASDARAEAETRLAEADRAAKAADHALAEAREERAGAEARSESSVQRLDELRHRIQDELAASPDQLPERAELKDGAELPPLEQAEKRVEKLKAEREQLGGVNLRAEAEAAEQEQRMDALTADRADLEGAIERLRRGIQTLNREGRERLLESFGKVNANFERLFKELFQGGEARLTFTESEDPLEAGLEILARPPGKKLTTLSLLSGGEQALTAIALIFAVFLVNPAPICVLDEVDAPLDDANVDRFCRLLDEMTRLAETRYLIITHHALTMSRMNRLFGVTMMERGVSQLVSVSLAEAERVAAA